MYVETDHWISNRGALSLRIQILSYFSSTDQSNNSQKAKQNLKKNVHYPVASSLVLKDFNFM